MKILLASSSSGSRGGGEIFLLYLGMGLTELGHQVVYWASDDKKMDEISRSFKPIGQVIRAPYRNTYERKLRSVSSYCDHATSQNIAASWADIKPDVILINKQNLEDGLELVRATQGMNIPSVVTIHLTQTESELNAVGGMFRDFFAGLSLQDFEGILVAVEERRSKALSDFLGGRIAVYTIENGVPDIGQKREERQSLREYILNRFGWAKNTFLITGVGRLVDQKRPMLWVDIASRLAEEVPETRFIWLGDGTLSNAFEAEIMRRSLSLNVAKAGWVSNVSDYVVASDLLLHTASYEGLPLAILESFAAQTPVAITEDLFENQASLEKDEVIVFSEPHDLADVIGNSKKLERYSHNARKRYENDYSLLACARKYESLFLEQINNKLGE